MHSNNSSSARSKPGALTMASATRLTWWVAWWEPWQPSATRPYTGEWLGDIHVDDMKYYPYI